MAVLRSRIGNPSPYDEEFKALEETVSIIPTFSMEEIVGLDGAKNHSYGPFTADRQVQVPLWLALHLRSKKTCRIIPPVWLSLAELSNTLKAEQSIDKLAPPPHPKYLEISQALLEESAQDIESPDQIRILLKDLREARLAKIRDIVGTLNDAVVPMHNLTPMELSTHRTFFKMAFTRLNSLLPPVGDDAI